MKREISTLAEEIYSRGTALCFHKTTKARFYLKLNFEPNTLAFEDIRLYIYFVICSIRNEMYFSKLLPSQFKMKNTI